MRKILYSPGYGAGFVSWSHGSSKQKKFMLEYKPFVEFLEGGGKFTEILVKCEPEEYDASSGLLPKELIVQFKADWDKAFPEKAGDYPYLGGVVQLRVYKVNDGCVVRIEEYDGNGV